MESTLLLHTREPSFGIPTSCLSALSVYCQFYLRAIPFEVRVTPGDTSFVQYGEEVIHDEGEGLLQAVKNSELAFLDDMLDTRDLQIVEGGMQMIKELQRATNHENEEENENLYENAREAYKGLAQILGSRRFFTDRLSSLDASFLSHALYTLCALPDKHKLRSILHEHKNLVQYTQLHGKEFSEIGSLESLPGPLSPLPSPLTNWMLKTPMLFTYQQLCCFTLNFKKKLGSGAFGNVHKGWIIRSQTQKQKRKGQAIAVKVGITISKGMNASFRTTQWKRELQYLTKLKHPNIIRLLGYSTDEDTLSLVYEYMKHGSVYERLAGLDWPTTIKIALGSAEAMQYMHAQTPPVINRDFRAANILLDEEYNPKLSDFGLVHDEGEAIIGGPHGYADQSVIKRGTGIKKTDMHNIGIFLLQLLTEKGRVIAYMMDTIMEDLYHGRNIIAEKFKSRTEDAKRLVQLALNCIGDQSQRPTIEDVIRELRKIDTT